MWRRNAHSVPHSNFYRGLRPHNDSDPDDNVNWHADANGDGHRHSDSHGYPHSNGNLDPYCHRNSHSPTAPGHCGGDVGEPGERRGPV